MSTFLRSLASILVGMTLAICGVSTQAAPPVKVELATPAAAEQDTVDLDVVITGSGFEPGAAVDFFVTGGETDKGNVVVTQVTYHDSKKLTARVSLTNAKISDFDVKVTLMSGRNGKGITLFKVVAKTGARAGDTTAPGAISTLSAISATRAITLKFMAPGDDGAAGRAAGYDVYYNEGSLCAAVSGTGAAPPGGNWVLAPRSSETTAEISGAVDFFNVHAGEPGDGDGDGLAAGMPYCVAIRARDEVPNPGPWSFIDATTLGAAGDWDLSPRYRLTGGTRATAVNFDYPIASGAPVLGWVVTDPSGPSDRTRMQFESSLWVGGRVDVAAAPISRIDNFRMIAIPDGIGRVGAVFGGYSSGYPSINYHRLVEIGPNGSTVETAVAGDDVVGGIAAPGAGITYIQRGAAWNPVIAFERIVARTVSKGKVTWTVRLVVTERVAAGVWQEQSTDIARTDATSGAGPFQSAQLFTRPGGTTLGLLVSHCGVLFYAERDPDTLAWQYWDAGPGPLSPPILDVSTNQNFAIGFNDAGAPIIARRTAYNGVLQITHPLTDPELRAPPVVCAGVSSRKNAWETTVAMAADDDLPYIGVTAVAEVQGNVYVAMNAFHGRGKTADQRLVYRCAASPDWRVASIDRTNGQSPTAAFGPVVVDGRIRRAYDWNWPGSNNINPSALPDDFVVLASQSVASLCP